MQPLKYRSEIDGLRAFAVLAVVIFHAFPSRLPGGFIGVDVFFVISGYLITSIIFTDLNKGTFSFADFFGRRIRRIFPALILVMAASLGFGWFALFPDEYEQLGKHVASGAAFVLNFILVDESGYFDNVAETKPMLHLWSLAVEEQFYIVWPLALWFAWKRNFNLLTITITVAVISFYLNLKFVASHPTETFFWPVGRFWELLSGSILGWLMIYKRDLLASIRDKTDGLLVRIILNRKVTSDGSVVANLMAGFGFLLLFYGIFRINEGLTFPGKWALIPVLGALLLIAAGSKAWLNRVLLQNPIAVWFGLISYPLYLWHWPILSFMHILDGETTSRFSRIIAIIFSISFAWLTYKYIEGPVRKKTQAVMIYSLSLMIGFIGLSGLYILKSEGVESREWILKYSKITSQFEKENWTYSNNDICASSYQYKNAEAAKWWFCSQSKDGAPNILLLGDSYANHLYPGLIKSNLFNEKTILSIGACKPYWVESSFLNPDPDYAPCSGSRNYEEQVFVNELVEKEKSIEMVIFSGLRPKNNDIEILALAKRIDFFYKKGIKVVVFVPQFTIDYDIRKCFSRPFTKARDCKMPLTTYQEKLDSFRPVESFLMENYPNILIFNQNALFCDKESCNYKKNGMPLLRDQYYHISEYGSELMANLFTDWLITR